MTDNDTRREARAERDARTRRALDYLAAWGCAEGPAEGDFPTSSAWWQAWYEYIHARAITLHSFNRIEREAQERAELAKLVAARLPRAGGPRRGGPVGALSDDSVRAIRKRHAAGEARAAIATAFDISPMTVSRIALRQRHGHVSD
jgi:hypothetical protein